LKLGKRGVQTPLSARNSLADNILQRTSNPFDGASFQFQKSLCVYVFYPLQIEGKQTRRKRGEQMESRGQTWQTLATPPRPQRANGKQGANLKQLSPHYHATITPPLKKIKKRLDPFLLFCKVATRKAEAEEPNFPNLKNRSK